MGYMLSNSSLFTSTAEMWGYISFMCFCMSVVFVCESIEDREDRHGYPETHNKVASFMILPCFLVGLIIAVVLGIWCGK